MAKFDYKGFLKEGGIEKYLLEENFGNDIESRYQFVRPLMSRLPDTAYTESLIDGMEEGRAGDDKVMFDFYFVEAMKALGLEDELVEDGDLEDYYNEYRFNKRQENLDENDTILDEFLEMPAQEEEGADIEVLDDVEELEIEKDITININLEEGKFEVGDLVYRKFDDAQFPMKVVGVRKMFASPLQAVSVVGTSGGDKLEYDETQLIKLEEMEGEVQTENKLLKASNTLEDALNKVVDDLTDEQIDRFTDMILDLRDKVKAQRK